MNTNLLKLGLDLKSLVKLQLQLLLLLQLLLCPTWEAWLD